jgi:hypothetical protein
VHACRHCAVKPWLITANRDGAFSLTLRARAGLFGAGGHMVDRSDNEAVVVVRWLDGAHSVGFVRHVAHALGSQIA